MKVLTALRHLFIPHKHNDYKPHFFREVSLLIIVVLSIFLLGVSAGSSFLIHKTVLGANVTASVLIDLTNESRLAFNESPLVRNPQLDQAAQLKAENMVEEGYFAHNSPKGITPWHWMKEVGYTFLYAGENLAINFTDADEVRNAWLASPLHRANLLDVKFKEIGMATMGGLYKDGPTIYVVQMFGTPAKAKESPAVYQEIIAQHSESLPVEIQEEAETSQEPEIKGDKVEQGTTTPTVEEYSEIVSTDALTVVKNNFAESDTITNTSDAPVETYSKWYERLLFGGSYYVTLIYKILLGLVVVALLVMLFIEIRKQHWKHIAYGLAMLLVITLCILINQVFW